MIARRMVLAGAVGVLVAAGCSGGPRSYDDVAALAAAVSDAGIACDEVDPAPAARVVSRTGTCSGSEVTLFLFDDGRDLDAWKEVGTRVGPALVGPNWAVTGDRDSVARLAESMDGERY